MRKNSLKKSILSLALSAAMIATSLSASIIKADTTSDLTSDFDQMGQNEIVADMGAGWNLGNTMEAFNEYGMNEQMWGNPVVTPELFEGVKAAGFDTIRIPISLLTSIGPAPDYTIDEAWFTRVKEVVDYAYDAGLYVIVDGVHGDGYNSINNSWLLVNAEDQDAVKDEYQKIWQQYAEAFKDYDEHIIFESMNEVFDGNYYDPDPELYKNLNAYNQLFVDTIRQSGGNNAARWLLIPGWNTNIDQTTLDYGFELPSDTYRSATIPSDEQRLMISVHYYTPYEFCLDGDSSITQWGELSTDSSRKSTWGQEDYMETQFQQVYQSFVTKGYPVVVGEYCATDKSNKDADSNIYRAYFAKTLCTNCKKYGAIPCYWDIGTSSSVLVDRKTYEVVNEDIVTGIMDGIHADVIAPATIAPSPTMTSTGSNADVSVFYKCTSTDTQSGGIRFNLKVKNNSNSSVSLSDVKLRYWYIRDDGKWQSFNCYYAAFGSENVYGNMVRLPLSSAYDTADFYAEIGFGDGAGTLAPGETSGEMQITLTKYDNSSYYQADDYSFNSSMTDYTENAKITAYVNGNLSFGTQPDGSEAIITTPSTEVTPSASTEPSTPAETIAPTETVAPTESAEASASATPSDSTQPATSTEPSSDNEGVIPSVCVSTTTGSSINQSYSISSLGKKSLDLSKLSIRYYYSKSGNATQCFWCDNAGLQLNKEPYYVNLASDVVGTFYDEYLEITFDTDQTLATGTGSLNMGVRFAQADWSAYSDFIDNGYEVYYDGINVTK